MAVLEAGAGAQAGFGTSVRERRRATPPPTRSAPTSSLKVAPPERGRDRAHLREAPPHRVPAPARRNRGGNQARAERRDRVRARAGAAHHARAVDGRALVAGEPGRLPRRADRGARAAAHLPDARDRRGHDPARARVRDRRRRRRSPGDRHGAPARRDRRGVRRAPVVAEQVQSLGARFVQLDLETGDAQDAGGYAKAQTDEDLPAPARRAGQEAREERRRDHDRARAGPRGAEADQCIPRGKTFIRHNISG